MRVLALDAGMNLGFAAAGDRPVISGSRRLRGGPRQMGETGLHCTDIILKLLADEKPDLVCFASPFVGQVWMPARGGRPGKFQPIAPDNIRPLFGLLTVIEVVCARRHIMVKECEENEARRALLGSIPRGTKNIKEAIVRACKQRGWPCCDHHAGDALCIASYVWEHHHKDAAHRMTPLFHDQDFTKST